MNIPGKSEIELELAKRVFKRFVSLMWPCLEDVPLVPNFHLDAICDHLQAVHEGKTKDLIINIPFRLGKSVIVSVMYPAWVWVNDPGHKFICTSHTHKTVIDNALRMRKLISTELYQKFFPGGLKLVKDTENYISNQWGGHRMSYSVETAVTGITGNTLIIDDPMTTATALSTADRERVQRALANDFMTRLTPPGQGRRIIVMQRLHQEDTSGHYLRQPAFDRLIIPARWDGQHRSRTCLGWVDPRTEIGQSIFPAYMSDKFLDDIRIENGPQFFASQLQQTPVAADGSIIKYEWINTYKELPTIKRITLSCDTAIKIEQANDYSVITVWGESDSGYYLLDMVRKKVEFPELKKLVAQVADKYKPHQILVEDKASGQQIIQEFKRTTTYPIIGINPKGTKAERLNLVSGLFEAGKIFIPDQADFALDFIEELCNFPYAKHDDIVDSVSQYLNRVRSSGGQKRMRII